MTTPAQPCPPIVVGVDGSHAAQLALRWALAEAALMDCPVRVVHAWSTGSVRDFAWTSRRSLRADSVALLRTALAAARRSTDSAAEATCHSVEGSPAVALVGAASEASLLVLGAHHGRRASGLGRVGSFCVRHLTVPVVIVPPLQRPGWLDLGTRWARAHRPSPAAAPEIDQRCSELRRRSAARTAACVRRCMPSLASRCET